MLFEIKQDCLNITDRIKEIDKDYFIVFNIIKNKYELHCTAQTPCTYCLTYPHDALDERLCELAKNTSRQNLDEILKQIDVENEKLEKEKIQQQKSKLEELYDS